MPRFTPEELFQSATKIIRAIGASDEDAHTVADHLVNANLAGHDSHGVIRIPQYHRDVEVGKIDPRAAPTIVRETSTTALIDGNSAWGQVVAKRATEIAIEKAKAHGSAALSVRNCYHIGRVGVYPHLAATEGFICELFCNGHGMARVAPWGGTEARLATNPIAVGIPTRDEPVVVDITTSVVAEGKVRVAKNANKNIPEGWILDSEGRPTTNPGDLYEGGTILPVGGPQGHKGFGLSLVVDLLGGVLSNAGCGFMTDRSGNGLFLQVIDPEAFEDRETFLTRVTDYLAYVRSSERKAGVKSILLPGEPESRTMSERRRTGLDIDDVTWSQISDLAAELGLDRA